jgi:hypothetical protein
LIERGVITHGVTIVIAAPSCAGRGGTGRSRASRRTPPERLAIRSWLLRDQGAAVVVTASGAVVGASVVGGAVVAGTVVSVVGGAVVVASVVGGAVVAGVVVAGTVEGALVASVVAGSELDVESSVVVGAVTTVVSVGVSLDPSSRVSA